jgi:hypothetical protein
MGNGWGHGEVIVFLFSLIIIQIMFVLLVVMRDMSSVSLCTQWCGTVTNR